MKKYLFLIAFLFLGLGLTTFSGCGSKSSSSKVSEVSEDTMGLSKLVIAEDYRKACELKEFSTAYEIVDKLKKKTSEKKVKADADAKNAEKGWSFALKSVSEYEETKKVSDEAEKYVVLQEALFVLESKGTDGIMRIVGIAKEHNAEGWLFIELLDVAKKIGDTDLANRFESIIQSTISNLSNMSLSDISLINYLAGTKDEKNSEKIIGLLVMEEKNIPTKPMMGKINIADFYYKDNVCDPYTKAVKKYNDQCSMVLNVAIKHGNQYLAKRSISKIKTNINSVRLPISDNSKLVWHYLITNDNEDIKSANATYQEAVRSGAFK